MNNPVVHESIFILDGVGPVGVAVQKETHEAVLLVNTPIGQVDCALSMEQALRLGISLIRISGQKFNFTARQQPVVGPPQKKETGDEGSTVSSVDGDIVPDGDVVMDESGRPSRVVPTDRGSPR